MSTPYRVPAEREEKTETARRPFVPLALGIQIAGSYGSYALLLFVLRRVIARTGPFPGWPGFGLALLTTAVYCPSLAAVALFGNRISCVIPSRSTRKRLDGWRRRIRWLLRRGPRRLQAARARRSLKTGGDPFLAFLALNGEHEAAKATVSMMITAPDPARRAAIFRDVVLGTVAPGGGARKTEAPR